MQAAKDLLKAYGAISLVVALFSIHLAVVLFTGALLLAGGAYATERW